MKDSNRSVAVVLSLWRDSRRNWSALVAFEVSFKLLQAWLLTPFIAVALGVVMARADKVAVNDWDMLDFLLSPVGLIYACLLGVCTSALLLFEHAVVIALAARRDSTVQSHRPFLTAGLSLAWRVTQLGALKFGLLMIAFAPFVLVLGLTYLLLLSQQDINYYLSERPPAFWLSVGIGLLLVCGGTVAGIVLAVRWAFALPILVYERVPARDALKAGRSRVQGISWQVGSFLVGWQLCLLASGVCLNAGFSLIPTILPESAGEDSLILFLLLILRGVLLAVLSFVGTVGQALLIRRMYLMRSEQLGLQHADWSSFESAEPDLIRLRSQRTVWVAVAAMIGLPVAIWWGLSIGLDNQLDVRITAHRGHELVAPENTLSAVRAAIDIGADYAEIDVQLTSDGHVVLLHDRDLKRVTGDPRRIQAIAFGELQELDAGSWFGSDFSQSGIPKLAETIDVCRGRIKLNIELKFYGADRRLAGEVARVVSEKQFESECVITSFNHDALLEVRRQNPRIRTGLIVAAALGDVTRLEGDVLSIRMDQLSDRLLRQARRRGLEIHVWGVKSERQMVRQMLRGVDNIITGDPERVIRVRARLAEMSDAERLVLASRVLLGLEMVD